jgi:hypothetical protein
LEIILRTSILQVLKVTQRPSFHSGFNTSHTSLGACKSGVRKIRSRTKEVLVLGGYGIIGSTYTCVNSESPYKTVQNPARHRVQLVRVWIVKAESQAFATQHDSSTYTCVDSERM